MPHLTQGQRYQIQTLLAQGQTQKQVAHFLGVHPSTISRELQRNQVKGADYQADLAQQLAQKRHQRQPWKIDPVMEQHILERLHAYDSPEQIVGRARFEGTPIVSTETIYRYIYRQQAAGKHLVHLLRWNRPYRKKRSLSNDKRGQIPDRILIDQRPSAVEERNRIGDFEVDLVIGKGHKKAILTLVDRSTRELSARLIDDKSAPTVSKAMLELLENKTVRTITSDNGKEFADHQTIATTLKALFFFAHPYHSWERGTNENMNGLLRQFIPKNRPLDAVTQAQLDAYVNNLNNRPRKTLNFKTPIECFQELAKNDTLLSNCV